MRPFDLGQVYSTGEAIKAQRIQNQQAPMRNAMLQQQLDNARQSNQFAQNQEQRAQTQFDQDQSLATLKDLYTGTTEIMNNFTAANRYIPRWKEAGLMPEGAEWDQMNPGEQMNLITATNRAAGEALKAQQQVSYKSASTPSSVQEWNYYQSLSPEQKKEFLNMKRSGNVKYLDTGTEFRPMSTSEPVQVGDPIPKGVKPENQPGNIVAAEEARNQVEAQQKKKENDKAFKAYMVGMRNLGFALSQTDTGPMIGQLPALTSAQQTAEGAGAVMAPILKQLFRTAGEGTFTDKDQELLLNMLPSRTDTETARINKINFVNAVVAAKLGITQNDEALTEFNNLMQENAEQPQIIKWDDL